jgi:hypothetical protein
MYEKKKIEQESYYTFQKEKENKENKNKVNENNNNNNNIRRNGLITNPNNDRNAPGGNSGKEVSNNLFMNVQGIKTNQ